MQMTINEFNVKKQEYSYFPTVQLYANYTFQQLSREFKFFNSSTWFPYNYLGVQVNIPIFDGLLKSRTRSEFIMKKQINQNNIDKLKSDINYELQSAYVTLQNAYRNMRYTRDNYQQAKDLVVVYQTRFKEGAILNSDLLNTEYSLQTAQNNLMNAYYDYLLAKLKWQKAKGEL
jgi:outer membrane protein